MNTILSNNLCLKSRYRGRFSRSGSLVVVFALVLFVLHIDQLQTESVRQRILTSTSHIIATENVSLTLVGVEPRRPTADERMHFETSLFYHLNDALKKAAIQTSDVSIQLETIKVSIPSSNERRDLISKTSQYLRPKISKKKEEQINRKLEEDGKLGQLDMDVSIAARFLPSHTSDFASLVKGAINLYSDQLLHSLRSGASLSQDEMSLRDYYSKVNFLVCTNAVEIGSSNTHVEDREGAVPYSAETENPQFTSPYDPSLSSGSVEEGVSTENGGGTPYTPPEGGRPNFVAPVDSNESDTSDSEGAETDTTVTLLEPNSPDIDVPITSDLPQNNNNKEEGETLIISASRSKASYYRTVSAAIFVSVVLIFIMVNIVRVNRKRAEIRRKRIEQARKAYDAPMMLGRRDHRGQPNFPVYEKYISTMDGGNISTGQL